MGADGGAARERGLMECAGLIDRLQLAQPAPPDAALAEPIASDPLPALDQTRRRGLDPRLVDVLWKWLEPRPLELGLFAWDVLCNSLIPVDDEMRLARLRKAARVVSEVLPEPGRAFADTSRVSAAKLVEKVAMPAFEKMSDEARFNLLQAGGLAAVEMYLLVSEPEDPQLAQLLASARRLARFFQLGHMSTLATFYFNYLWKRAGQKEVLFDYVEAMLDAHAYANYPARDEILVDKNIEEIELIGYMLARSAVQLGQQALMIPDFRNAPNPIDYKKGDAKALAKTFQRSHLVHAELFLDVDETPVPFAVVQEVVKANPSWRYAGRVRLALLARLAPPEGTEPLKVLDNFVSVFGNERWAWSHMDHYSPAGDVAWLDGFQARIVREVTQLPHDRTAWEALGIVQLLSDDQETWLADIKDRAAEQCKLD